MRGNRQSGTSKNRLRKKVDSKSHVVERAGNRQSSDAILADLKRRLSEIYDLNAAGAVLGWDEATYMPKGGARARGRQSALLRRLAHERFVDPEVGKQIDRLEPHANKLPAAVSRRLQSALNAKTGLPAEVNQTPLLTAP